MTPGQRRWKDVEVGDVLRARNGLLRVVRHVCHSAESGRTSVSFVIKRCSWTERCYTVYTDNDLNQFGYRKTGKKFFISGILDKAITEEVEHRHKPLLTCCDVRGIS